MPDIDHMDIGARQENLAVRGEPIMLQLCVAPAYALTIHKTQVRFDAGLAWPLVDTCLVSAWALGLDLRQACAGPVDQASRHRLPRRRLRHGAGLARTCAHGHPHLPLALLHARALQVYVLISRVTDPQVSEYLFRSS